jgi:transcriptional regulator with XRE-family HTH domain
MSEIDVHPQNDAAERKRLGEKLREARKYLGLKQEEVAGYLKIQRISKMVSARWKPSN